MTQSVSLDSATMEQKGLSRRSVLQLGGLTAVSLCVPWSTTAWAASPHASYAPTLMRYAYSGDPSQPGTERWQWQGLQGDRPRPSMSIVPQQYLYATTVKRPSDPGGITQCVRPGDVPDEWVLRDRGGAMIHRGINGVGGDYALDVGNTGYRDAAAAFLVRKCQTERWSGILLDEVNPEIAWAFPGATPVKYPTDAAWQNAMRGFVQTLATRLKAAGFLLVGNIGTVEWHRTWCESLVQVGMVCNSEFFVCGAYQGAPVAAGDVWQQHMDWMDWAQANSPNVILHDKQDGDQMVSYGLCSFLLADTGKGVYGADVSYDASTRYLPIFDSAKRLGAPLGVRTQVARGLWRRDFSSGYVVVNSSLGATNYQGRSIAPTSGTLFVSAQQPAPPNSPPPAVPPYVPPAAGTPPATPPAATDWLSLFLDFIRRLFGI